MAFPERAVSLTMPYEEFESLGQPDPQDVSKLFREWELTEKAKKLKGKYGGPCVTFARNFTESTPDLISGMARNIPTNSQEPQLGAIVKTNESKYGHLAVIISENWPLGTVIDSNYGWDGVIRIRTIRLDDNKILGYIIKNN